MGHGEREEQICTHTMKEFFHANQRQGGGHTKTWGTWHDETTTRGGQGGNGFSVGGRDIESTNDGGGEHHEREENGQHGIGRLSDAINVMGFDTDTPSAWARDAASAGGHDDDTAMAAVKDDTSGECGGSSDTSEASSSRLNGAHETGETDDCECDDDDEGGDIDATEKRDNEIRMEIMRCRDEMFASDPGFETTKKITDLNTEAVRLIKDGDDIGGIAAYAKLFYKLKKQRLVHAQLYVVHLNRAGCYLRLRLYSEALWDSFRAARMAREALEAGGGSDPAAAFRALVKSSVRRGEALLGLGRCREAASVFQDGLRHDPFGEDMKAGLEAATQGILDAVLNGDGLINTYSLPPPEATMAIQYHKRSAPLSKLRDGNMLPSKLLTPFQAENDYNIKDTYNYMTVQTDIRKPRAHIAYLEDEARWRYDNYKHIRTRTRRFMSFAAS